MLKDFIYKNAIRHCPSLFFKLSHYRLHKNFGTHAYWANLQNPKTFNEKLLASKLSMEHEHLGHLVDKELVKDYVKDKIGSEVIIPTIAVFQTAVEFNLDALRFPCILKPTHSSSRVLKIKNKDQFTEEKIRETIRPWFTVNHYDTSGEPQYKHLKPKVIAEELIGDLDSSLYDYKIFSFNGEPAFIQVDIDRGIDHTRAFYDVNWIKQNFTIKYPMYKGEVPKPELLDKMVHYACILSRGQKFARIDFYNVNSKIYFGEITFHHESGYGPFTTYEDDLNLGKFYKV